MSNHKGKKKRKFGWWRKTQHGKTPCEEEEIVSGCYICKREDMFFSLDYLVWGDELSACPGCGIDNQAVPITMHNGKTYTVRRRW